jgi:hypothetical protein
MAAGLWHSAVSVSAFISLHFLIERRNLKLQIEMTRPSQKLRVEFEPKLSLSPPRVKS